MGTEHIYISVTISIKKRERTSCNTPRSKNNSVLPIIPENRVEATKVTWEKKRNTYAREGRSCVVFVLVDVGDRCLTVCTTICTRLLKWMV